VLGPVRADRNGMRRLGVVLMVVPHKFFH